MKKATLVFLLAALICNACNQNKFIKSEDGFEYMMVNDAETDAPQDGNMLMFEVAYYNENDSVLFSTDDIGQPVIVKYDEKSWSNRGPFFKALKILTPGDSALIRMTASQFYTMSMRAPLPKDMTDSSQLTIHLKFNKEMDQDGFMEWQNEQSELQKQKDIEKIDAYLAENNIEAKVDDATGLRYVVEVEGSGEHPAAGDSVEVNYRGQVLEGEQFDSSFDRNETYTFLLGRNQVIQGWDKGIPLFTKGGKGTVYIPSSMGYGQRGAGRLIPPNSILVFDIELLDIKKNN